MSDGHLNKGAGLTEDDLKGAENPAAGHAPQVLGLECPNELPPIAQEEWNRIVGELAALGILSKFDRAPLTIYCGAYALWVEAFEAIQKYGTMMKSPTGYPVQSPYVAILNRQAETLMRLSGEFGFTPAARSRNFSYAKSSSMLLEQPRHVVGTGLEPL
jgi:P27 family predicted phage terminase small subunit